MLNVPYFLYDVCMDFKLARFMNTFQPERNDKGVVTKCKEARQVVYKVYSARLPFHNHSIYFVKRIFKFVWIDKTKSDVSFFFFQAFLFFHG